MRIVRRLGSTPAQRGSLSGETCPDVLETDAGDFLVVGKVASFEEVEKALVFGASVGIDEMVVKIPRRVLVDARKDIPDE